MGKKKRFYIETLGCKVNQYESDGIAANLESAGLERQQATSGADVCIINTCAVTSKAGMQSRQAIRRLIRDNPGARIIVTGCHAQTDPGLIKTIEDIDHIVCHQDKTKILACVQGEGDQALCFRKPGHGPENRFITFDAPVKGEMTRAYLKIQDGCNAFCTYCIVPHARGGSVSMEKKEVLRHITALAEQGFNEVILSGIHIGMYGQDLHPPLGLLELMETLDHTRPVSQVRISSIEPREICQGLIDLARPGHILCDHFHIPLQSGDNAVLKRMKRPYTAEEFAKVVTGIRSTLPLAGIGLDTLIGFPGETDAEFDNTFSLVESLPVSYLHVFPFSARKGTPAFSFEPKIPPAVVKARCAAMRELDRKKRISFLEANAGKTLRALVQHQPDKATGHLKAVTTNYLTPLIAEKGPLAGKMVDLVYEEWDKDLTPIARVVEKTP